MLRAAALTAAAWSLPAAAPLVPALADALGTVTHEPDPATVAITFDDGPHPRGTPAVLDILAAHGATATFFLVGEQVRRTGSLLGEITAAGHAVAVHGDRHRNLLRLSPRAIADDFARASDTIGAHAPQHRAPYGIYSWAALREARKRGWAPVLWSAWGRDWAAQATAASITRTVLADLSAGGIVLLHDADDYSAAGSYHATVRALPRILDAVAQRGLRPVHVSGR